jgi:hypothetical protein
MSHSFTAILNAENVVPWLLDGDAPDDVKTLPF